MLARSLFTFAALSLLAVPAIAQDIPVRLVPPQEGPLVGKYAAKGVQIYVCSVEGGASEWGFKAPEAELIDAQGRPFAKHYAGPTWEAPDGSKIVGRILASEPAQDGRNSLAATVGRILGIGGAFRGAVRSTGQHFRRSRADRHVSNGRNRAACRLHG